jgi:hypothetical protein
MSEFAYRFFKEEIFNGNVEDNLDIIIDNYSEALEMYRVMKIQTEENKRLQKEAHKALKDIWDKESKISSSDKELTEQEKLELEEKKEFLKKQREQEVSMYYKGNKIEYNELTHVLIKYEKYLEHVEKADKRGRDIIGSGAKIVSSIGLWPLKKMCRIVANQTENSKVYNALAEAERFIKNIPCNIKSKITKSVNMEDHLPKIKDKKKDHNFEINITV